MAARSIASLSLTFGLVSIPVKLYSATESSSAVSFHMLTPDGARVKQQYISTRDGQVVERSQMVKGYEFEKDRFVMFSADELKALQESPSHTVEIVAFIPEKAVDPIYFDKAYFLAPDKRGAKPYNLLMAAMRKANRCALATWAWKGKQYVVQVRPGEDGLVLQQLLYADEVRSMKELDIEKTPVSDGELQLALQLIQQIAEDEYDPGRFEDKEKQRILAAIDEKIAGHHIVAPEEAQPEGGAQVIDLMEALRASLGRAPAGKAKGKAAAAAVAQPPDEATAVAGKERKGVRRASAKAVEEPAVAAPAPARARARK
jgi:DNA end-binding protein Ku